jgi:hypothetical protein
MFSFGCILYRGMTGINIYYFYSSFLNSFTFSFILFLFILKFFFFFFLFLFLLYLFIFVNLFSGHHPFANANGTINMKRLIEGEFTKIVTKEYNKEIVDLCHLLLSLV